MKKAQIDLQIKQAENRAIAELQNNMMILDQAVKAIDSNSRSSHSALVTDMASLILRVNFIFDELKSKLTEEEKNNLEERFKKFAEIERTKMHQRIAEQIKKREEENKNE